MASSEAGLAGNGDRGRVPARRGRVGGRLGRRSRSPSRRSRSRRLRSGSTPPIPSALVLTAPGYRLTLSKANGEIVDLLDRRNGVHVLRGQNGCMWSAKQTTGVVSNGCGYGPGADGRFSYRWSQVAKTLTLAYDGADTTPGVDATVTSWPQRRRSIFGSRCRATSSTRSRPCSSRPTCSATRTASMPATRRRSCRASDSARRSSRARTGTSRPIPRAGCSPTSSPPTSGRATSPCIRSTPRRAPSRRSIWDSSGTRNRHRAPTRPSASRTCSRRGSSTARAGRARWSGSASAARSRIRCSPTVRTTASTPTRRSPTSSAPGSTRLRGRR